MGIVDLRKQAKAAERNGEWRTATRLWKMAARLFDDQKYKSRANACQRMADKKNERRNESWKN